ncbi:MAG: cyclic nucleotide-binding domain-containing protein [Helicobacteraceae bacterium]|nr:cyclic nucleotide-binding domain-containing protein [Helicobacteraceae bacterium]
MSVKFLNKHFSKTHSVIEHHIEIFGIKQDLKDRELFSLRAQIGSVYRLFSLLDNKYDTKLSHNMFNDIISFFNFHTKLEATNAKILYKEYSEEAEKADSFAKFQDYYNSEVELNSFEKRILSILNTKLYYFDLLIFDQARKSKPIQQYLFSVNAIGSTTTVDFLKKSANRLTTFEFEITPSKLMYRYKSDDIAYLKDLYPEELGVADKNLIKLLSVKDRISFFENMKDNDIKAIVKDPSFLVYKKGDIIIQEGEKNDSIYFIFSGKCQVIIGEHNIAELQKSQVFGEFAFLLDTARSASVVASSPTSVLRFRLDCAKYESQLNGITLLYKNFTDELVKKILHINMSMANII